MGFFSRNKKNEDIPEIPAPPVFIPNTFENKNIVKTNSISSEKKDSGIMINNAPPKELIIPPINSTGSSQLESIPLLPQSKETSSSVAPQPIQQKPNTDTYKSLIIPPVSSVDTQRAQSIPVLHESESHSIHHTAQFVPAMENVEKFTENKTIATERHSYNKDNITVKKDASESIFVRIDKFRSAKKDIEEIDRELKQISQVMNKISDIKMKEDGEIAEVTKIMDEIKNKIQKVDSEIFNRI